MTSIRTCIGCGQRAAKAALRRVVRDTDRLELDAAKRAPGRGGYLHADVACLRRFARGKGPIRSLRWSPGPAERTRLAASVERLIGGSR